ncbi:MAG: hypothetical protein STHCBS139747_004876 [Sporothrix thermara]
MASISHRVSIAWLPAPPSEPTSTVVLTSPGRWFVDVRILLPLSSTHPQLDWALAGTSSSTPVRPGVSDCVWRHWVDSRHANDADTEAQVDRGRNTDQPDDGTVLETGSMVNPATGQVQDYEEVWRDDDMAAGDSSTSTSSSNRCAVLQHHEVAGDTDGSSSRGVVIVLGPYCQGILRTKEGVTVERWQRGVDDGDDNTKDRGSWKLVFRLGSGELPCKMVTENESLIEGEHLVDGSNQRWTVIEATQA